MALWLPLGDGSYRLTEITADAEATMRGGDLRANPAELWGDVVPWADGSLDRLRWRLLLPEGVRVNRVRTTGGGAGWSCDLSNGEAIEINSLYPTRWLPYLDGFERPGVKSVWWRDVGAILDNGGGEWVAERFEITTVGGVELFEQYCDNPEDQDPWAVGSITMMGASHKRNNRTNGPRYTTGIIGQWPAPLAIFWDSFGGYVGKVVGRLAWNASEGVLEKRFPMAVIAPFASGGASLVSTDGTLGYTGNGGLRSSRIARNYWYGGFTASENGTVDSFSFYDARNSIGNTYFGNIYPDNSGMPDGSYPVTNSTSPSYTANGLDTWFTVNYVNKPSITSGTTYWLNFCTNTTGNTAIRYSTGGSSNARYISGVSGTQSPCGTTTSQYTSVATSIYITYTVSTPDGQPAWARHRNWWDRNPMRI